MVHLFPQLREPDPHAADLPHANKGDPEDADTDAEDHCLTRDAYLLINLGGGPSWPDVEPPKETPFDGVELLEPRGPFAWRPGDDDAPERDPRQVPSSAPRGHDPTRAARTSCRCPAGSLPRSAGT